MGMFERYMGMRSRQPFKLVEAMLVSGTRPVWEPIVGVNLNENEIRIRRANNVVEKARIGAQTMSEGSVGDERKRRFGEAMVVAALMDADKPDDPIAGEAVKNIAAAVVTIDDLDNNPYVHPDTADKVKAILLEPPQGPLRGV